MKLEVNGVVMGRKAMDEVGLLKHTCKLFRETQKTQPNLVSSKSDCVIVSLHFTNDKNKTDFETNECGPLKYLRITFASHQNKISC